MRALPILLSCLAVPARADVYLGVGVNEYYDSNVENSHGPDAVTEVAPRVGLHLLRHTWQLDADYLVAMFAYALGRAQNSVNQRAALAIHDQLAPRAVLDVRGVFIDGTDPILIERAAVAVPFGAFVDLTTAATLTLKSSRRTTLSLAYMYRLSRFSDPMETDGDEHRADSWLTWRWTRRLDLLASVRGQKFVTYQGPDPGGALGGTIGLGYDVARMWRAQIAGGPLLFLPAATPTWIGEARLTRTGRRTRLSLVGSRDLYGGTGNQQAIWDDALYLQLVWQAARNIWVHARSGAYVTGNAPNGARNVTGLDVAGDVGWVLWHGVARIDLFGEYRYQDVQNLLGVAAFANVSRTIAGVRLVAFAGGTHGDDLP
jgi:hypothetical protein